MRTPRIQALAVAALLLAAACDDITSTSPGLRAEAPSPKRALLGTVTCHVDEVAQTTRCGELVERGGANLTRVTLTTSHFTLVTGTSFTSGGVASFFNKIQNGLGQDIGTHNGIQADSIRAFVTAINVTGGTGTVTPRNHTGTATFTAANQPYWEWVEIVTASGGQSSTFVWEFNVPGTVTTWNYTVGVSAPIAHPDGWVNASGDTQIPNGGARTHTAVVYDWTGAVVTSGFVLWSDSDSGGSVSQNVLNSRQVSFQGTSVGYAEIYAYHGFATPDAYAVEVY
jgi:hypothetical protein